MNGKPDLKHLLQRAMPALRIVGLALALVLLVLLAGEPARFVYQGY
jgi:hypothetical protein